MEKVFVNHLNDQYASEIAREKKIAESDAYQDMMDAVQKYGMSKDTYMKEKFYLLSPALVDRYFSRDNVRARVEYISEKYDAPKGHVYRKILDCAAKHKIPIQYFAAHDLYEDTSDECMEFHRSKRREARKDQIEELMSITGWNNATVEKYIKDIFSKYGVDLVYILDNELFKRSDEEIEAIIQENKEDEERRIKRIKEETGWSDYEFERHRVNCRYRYRIHELKTYDNLECWRLSNDVLDTYAVPRDAFILKDMYDTASTDVLDDKTLFDQTFQDFLGRKFWINRDTSIEEFKEFIDGLDTVFCKPINLNGGHGIYRYELNGTPEEMYEYFMNEPLMLVEEMIKQHHLLNEIYPGCINSIRIMSILKDGKFECFASWIKFGAGGSQVDGRVDGGSFAGVDEKTGIVVTKAVDGDNNRLEFHPDTGTRILGFRIPYWKEVLELTEKALRHIDGIDFVGWDVAITETGPVIVEGNSKPAFADYQLLFAKDFGGMKKKYAHLLPRPGTPDSHTNSSGWSVVNGKRYYYKYGYMVKNGWLDVDGEKYYLAEDGHMLKNGWLTLNGKKYYLAEDGHMLSSGWIMLDGKEYYLNKSGVMQTGWITVKDERYYLAEDGHMLKNGWLTLNGKKYYLAKDGHALNDGWLTVDGKKYYLNCSGLMRIGWFTIDDKRYYLGMDGARRTGWQTIGGDLYYFDGNGVMQIS